MFTFDDNQDLKIIKEFTAPGQDVDQPGFNLVPGYSTATTNFYGILNHHIFRRLRIKSNLNTKMGAYCHVHHTFIEKVDNPP